MVYKEIGVILYCFAWEQEYKDITLLQLGEGKYTPALFSFFKGMESIEVDVLGLGALYRFIRDKLK